jgi:hypothetical protein
MCLGAWQGELQSVANCHIVNDPKNTANVWLRVDHLAGGVMLCVGLWQGAWQTVTL